MVELEVVEEGIIHAHPQVLGASRGKLQYPSNFSLPREQCPSSVREIIKREFLGNTT
ncbi:hypothetical protein [Metallosphaera yellowstonensis]|uniref:hypothetical protein n=1 Tax=Metallosphaera yellowstonensis TaxID=1111107 RepID=UPI0012DE022E|nr:hypothetical protein [Metallosphaera yellowstonensis]